MRLTLVAALIAFLSILVEYVLLIGINVHTIFENFGTFYYPFLIFHFCFGAVIFLVVRYFRHFSINLQLNQVLAVLIGAFIGYGIGISLWPGVFGSLPSLFWVFFVIGLNSLALSIAYVIIVFAVVAHAPMVAFVRTHIIAISLIVTLPGYLISIYDIFEIAQNLLNLSAAIFFGGSFLGLIFYWVKKG